MNSLMKYKIIKIKFMFILFQIKKINTNNAK